MTSLLLPNVTIWTTSLHSTLDAPNPSKPRTFAVGLEKLGQTNHIRDYLARTSGTPLETEQANTEEEGAGEEDIAGVEAHGIGEGGMSGVEMDEIDEEALDDFDGPNDLLLQ